MEDIQIFSLWETFKDLLKSTNREGIDTLLSWLDQSDFKFAPASTQYHNNIRGGLLAHSLDVYYHMHDFDNLIKFFDIPEESLIITALLHDICKVNCYKTDYRNTKDANGNWIKVPYYTWEEQEPLGHGDKSIMLMYEYAVKPTKIERAMIRNHMGFSNDEDARRVSHLFSKCPQALVLHYADELATFVTESKDLQSRFREKLTGRNINECLINLSKPKTIKIDGCEYTIAPKDAIIDNKEIITVKDDQNNLYVVYAPHKDGLPF